MIVNKRKGKRKIQGVPQSQTAALPRPQEEEETDNLNKHKPNKCTKSIKISSLFPKRGNRNTKRTEKHKNKMTHGKTYNKSPRRINHKATKSKTNTGTTALERSVEQTTGGFKALLQLANFTLGPDATLNTEIHKNSVRIKAPNSVNTLKRKHKNQINHYNKQRRVLMANSTTVCQSKWKPIVEPRRAKPYKVHHNEVRGDVFRPPHGTYNSYIEDKKNDHWEHKPDFPIFFTFYVFSVSKAAF